MFIGFQSIFWLAGLLAAGIPVVIHLIHKRKAPKVFFSTLRFLKLSHEKTARVRRIHDLILLLMRAALFALLALALAQPVLQQRAASSSRNVAAAIILDNSCSMSAVHDGRSRFADAKQAASRILKETLGPADEVVILLTNPPAGAIAPGGVTDVATGAALLADADISRGRGHIIPAIARAREILAAAQKPNREVYIVTDRQQTGFDVGELEPKPDIPTFFVDVGRADLKNLAVVGCRIRARALVVGSPVTIEATISNFTPTRRTQTISLYIGKRKVDQKTVAIDPFSRLNVVFNRSFDKPGQVVGRVVLQRDAMPIDNSRGFRFDIGDRIPTLIVQDAEAPVVFDDDSFFLRPAIDPRPGEGGHSALRYSTLATSALGTADLSKARVAFLLNVQSLRAAAAAAVRRFVANGGGLVLFVGDRVDPDHYTNFLNDDTGELGPMMPVTLRPATDTARDDKPFAKIGDVIYEHPALAVLRGTDIIGGVHVSRTMPAEIAPGSTARVLMKLDDGRPLLIENRYGRGTVFLFTTTANAAWSNLPLKKAYVPLIHELVRYISRSGRVRGEYLVGASVTLSFPDQPEPLAIVITTPAGDSVNLTTDPAREPNGVEFTGTSRPGVYRWRVEGKASLTGAFVVNIAPEESRLAKAPESTVLERCGTVNVHLAASVDDLSETVTRYRKGVPLWDALFFALLLIALFESFFSNYIMPRVHAAREAEGAAPSIAVASAE